jgi:hypothetical protein
MSSVLRTVSTASAPTARTSVAAWNPWLLLVLQLPARPSNARVKTWRRLQQLGAVPVKNAAYVLPNSAQALEDFEWLRAEIESVKGQANIFSASSIDGVDSDDIVEQFRTARAADYKRLLKDVRLTQKRVTRASNRDDDLIRKVRQLRERLTHVRAIDFFSAPGGEGVEREIRVVEHAVRRTAESAGTDAVRHLDPKEYRARLWMTRPRPGVDRFASAWLISRFIDPEATFDFVDDPGSVEDAVPFDMFGTGFGHEGDLCTFEVLATRFRIADPAVRRIGEIVHDLDLKEDRFRAPQAAGVGVVVEGLRAAFKDDSELLRQGIILFDALYRGFEPPTSRSRRRTQSQSRKHGGSK